MNHPYPTDPNRLVNKKTVARVLDVSTRTVDRISAGGELPKVYIGGSVRFRWHDVLRLIQKGA